MLGEQGSDCSRLTAPAQVRRPSSALLDGQQAVTTGHAQGRREDRRRRTSRRQTGKHPGMTRATTTTTVRRRATRAAGAAPAATGGGAPSCRSACSALTGMPVQSRKRRTHREPRRNPNATTSHYEVNHTTAQPVDDSESDEVGVQEQGVRALLPRLAGTSLAAHTLECAGADGAAARRRRE